MSGQMCAHDRGLSIVADAVGDAILRAVVALRPEMRA